MTTPTPAPQRPTSLEQKALVWLVVGFTAAFALVLWPVSGAVLWAVFIAIVFAPLQRRALKRLGPRPGLASLLTLLTVVVIVILPLALIASSVLEEAAAVYQRVRSGDIAFGAYFQRALDGLPGWVRGLLQRFDLLDLPAWQEKLTAAITRSGQLITTQLLGIGQNTLDFVVAFFVMLYLLFFLLRDGEKLSAQIGRALPLQPAQSRRLLDQFATVVRATVKGNIVIALIQGALGGAAFWVLGLPGPLLWGALMAFLSLLPAVGAALVWGPVALYYVFTGALWPALGLTAWGVIVIGLVDNLLRPMLVGKDIHMPDYLVLVTTLGGLALFGLNGFVIGPVIGAMFLTVWDLFGTQRKAAALRD